MRKLLQFLNEDFIEHKLSVKHSLWASTALLLISHQSLGSPMLKFTEISAHEVHVTAIQTPIRGKIQDALTKEPISGATIKVLGKSIATSSDSDGNFQIAAALNDVLEITYIGFSKQSQTVTSTAGPLVIGLHVKSDDLEEVVVTGYSTQRKKDLTGAVAVVNVNELKSQPAASAVEALQGRATGVQIVNDGAPGSTPQIKIRGYSTINNNEPLYVIDGVPFEGKLSWLNQNDIETMQVLKDASAASIYGARANNGVVIITTKTGKANSKPMINLDAYVGVGVPNSSSFPKMMSPQQILDMDNSLNGTSLILPEYLLAGAKTRYDITAADVDMSKYNYKGKDRSSFYQITKANQAGTDWFKEITQNAPIQSYQLSSSGGGENATYAFSGGYLNQQGTVIHSGFKKYNIRTNTAFKAFNNKVRFGENMQYAFTEGYGMGVNPNTAGGYQGDGSVMGWAYRIQNIIPVYDEGGNFAGSFGKNNGNGENPVAIAYRAKDNKNKSNFFFGNVFAEADLIKGLTLRTNLGMRYENYNGATYTYPNPEFSEGSFNNGMSEYYGFTTEWTWTNTLNYRPELGENHNLNVLAGTEAIENRWREISGSRNGYFTMSSMDYLYLNGGTSNIGNAGSGTVGSMYSVFGKVDYSYLNRYLFSATVRRDGSSNFGEDNKYGVFPGISGAWRISEEDFAKDLSWLNDLKFRAGYGVTGNQRIPANQYINRYTSSLTSTSYPIHDATESGLAVNAYSNPAIKWEQVKALNVGLDFSLFQGDFDGAVDWYTKTTSDMLYRLPLPASAVGRAASPYVNIGSMKNTGLELALGYHYGHRQQKDFTLDIGANISKNKNEITELAPSITQDIYGSIRNLQTSILTAGQPYGAFFGYKTEGIYQSDEDVKNSASYDKARAGGLKYADLNGDGVITGEDRTVIGNPHPDFIYSLNINATYKNFDLAVFFYGSQGNDIYDATRLFTDFGVFAGQKSARLLDAWSPSNTGSSIPSLTNDASGLEYASSSYFVQDGSFLKLKNLQVGYSFDTKKLFGENTSFNKMRIYGGATNLLTFTKYDGMDPEVSAFASDYSAIGVNLGIYPQARQFIFGVSLGF